MADNVRLGTPDPAAELAASDEIGGRHFQLMKPLMATTATLVNASAAATFTALAAGACRGVYIENNRSGAVDLELRRGGAGGTRVIAAGAWAFVDAVANANELQLKRLDGLATAVTVTTELRS